MAKRTQGTSPSEPSGGAGDSFAPAGKVFREWVSISAEDPELWRRLLGEAVDFARKSLGDES